MSAWHVDDDPVGVPSEYQDAAEAVRAHLVALRGGAVFLSPADALKLVGWLDKGVPVNDILRAIERAAEYRKNSRSRVPLGLGQVGRHLGRPTTGIFKSPGALPTGDVAQALGPLLRLIAERAGADPLQLQLRVLAADLAALPEDDLLAQKAMTRIGAFHDGLFRELPDARRSELLEQARGDLGDLRHMLDDRQLEAIVDENARYAAREGYAWLSAATVWDLVAPEDC